MIWIIALAVIVAWIIKDHKAVMKELEAMRERGKLAENHSQSGIIDIRE